MKNIKSLSMAARRVIKPEVNVELPKEDQERLGLYVQYGFDFSDLY